jgi:hypothetical protein
MVLVPMDSMKVENYSELEAETRSMVSNALSKIEVALSEWDGAKDKPPEFAGRIEYFRKVYTALTDWMKGSLRGPKDPESVLGRLERFAQISRELTFPGV